MAERQHLVLASQSTSRQSILANAGIAFEARPAKVDEDTVTESLLAEGYKVRDIADALAELKALRISAPGLILGCDQTVEFEGKILGKPETPLAAEAMLNTLAGATHRLFSASVIVEDGKPIWRHVSEVRMVMRPLTQDYIRHYVAQHWDDIRHCAGAYQIERQGGLLFHEVRGDYFAVLGLALFPLVDFLWQRGDLSL